jgi:hypothetical protein
MNRRTALWTTLLAGALLPRTLLGQTPARRSRVDDGAGGFRKAASDGSRTARAKDADEPVLGGDEAGPAVEEPPPADFPNEPGQVWRTFDISRYTSLSQSQSNPQNAIVEWIFRRTGSAIWHGDKIAVLSASRTQIRAYHNPKILKQVEEIVDRFTKQEITDYLKVRVRFIAAADPRWRYLIYTRLTPLLTGPQGQQVWSLRIDEAGSLRGQHAPMFKLLADQEIKMVNGQNLTVETLEDVAFVSGPQRDAAAGFGYEQKTSQLKEGVVLKLSPLLNYEGDALDVAIDLKANTVRSLHRTKILARREIGAPDMALDVPEVVETRLNQTVPNWKPGGQTLLISAGIHPGILQSKSGFLNLHIPGTVPTSTELLVFLDVELVNSTPRTARSRD